MPETRSRVRTERGSRYIAQLCKHFGHKAQVSYDDVRGEVDFGFGRCSLHAGPDALTMHGVAPDPEALARVEGVVGGHLERFAWKEAPEISWTRA